MQLLLTPQPTQPASKPFSDRRVDVEPPREHRSAGFLFSPAIDLFFVANAFWPLLLLFDHVGGIATHQSLLFWQIYFVTAPHRWITLVLVAVDHHKGPDRRRQFLAFGTAILVACLCTKLGTGSLLCLGAIDYVWNAWHFASQHHGIFRLYERQGVKSTSEKLSPSKPEVTKPIATGGRTFSFERILFRGFLLYVIARVAGWGWSEGPFDGFQWVGSVDWILLAIPGGLIARELFRHASGDQTTIAGSIYLSSVMTLFISLLMAAHFENSQLVVQLALASAVFHSLEYMSIVTFSMNQTKSKTRSEVLSRLTKIWVLFLLIFIVVIGLGNYLLSRGYFELWVFANIVVAFWHYCFDGMIWKSRKAGKTNLPKAAHAL